MAMYKGLEVPAGATHLIRGHFYKERKRPEGLSELSVWKGEEWQNHGAPFSLLLVQYKKQLLPPKFQIDAWLEENKDD